MSGGTDAMMAVTDKIWDEHSFTRPLSNNASYRLSPTALTTWPKSRYLFFVTFPVSSSSKSPMQVETCCCDCSLFMGLLFGGELIQVNWQ
jgi:hypothetical protein